MVQMISAIGMGISFVLLEKMGLDLGFEEGLV